MKRATFAEAEPEEERGELAVAASPHHRLHQPSRSCLKEHHQDTTSFEPQRSSTTASPLSSLHHHHHHVQFLSNSGTIGGPQTAPTTSNQLVVIDLNKLSPSSQGTLSFRPVPFGMLRARHTYATRFAVVGGNGRTLVDTVAESIAAEVSVCKEPASDAASTAAGEMFEVIFRPLSRGPFEGVFHLWVESTTGGGRGGGSTFVRTESHDMGREEEEEEAEKEESAGDAKKRKMEPSSPHRYRLEVVITAQILRKGMGKPSLREGVRCIAIDDEEDSDADSDGWAGF